MWKSSGDLEYSVAFAGPSGNDPGPMSPRCVAGKALPRFTDSVCETGLLQTAEVQMKAVVMTRFSGNTLCESCFMLVYKVVGTFCWNRRNIHVFTIVISSFIQS